MGLQLVAVGLSDVATFGKDTFWVQTSATEAMSYEAFKDGRVVATSDRPLPVAYVTAAIEKWNSAFRVVPPIAIQSENDLVRYLGKFEPVSDTACQLVP